MIFTKLVHPVRKKVKRYMSSKRSNPNLSSSRTQCTRDNSTTVVTGLATSTTVPRRRKSDEIVIIDWPDCLSRRPSEVDQIAHSFSKIPLSVHHPVEKSVFKEVLKTLRGVIAKGTILETGIYHLVTTAREVLRIPHRRLMEYIQQQFVTQQDIVQTG